jgi:hypothetical protein
MEGREREGAMRRYPKVTEGEWVQPRREGYRMQCCDCGLVHRMQFRLVKYPKGHKIQMRGYRDNRATAQVRRFRGSS